MCELRSACVAAVAVLSVAVGMMLSTNARAANWEMFGWDMAFSGFVRAEGAYRTTDTENPWNQGGNLFNGVTVERNSGLPLNNLTTLDLPTAVLGPIGELIDPLLPLELPVNLPLDLPTPTLLSDTVTRPVPRSDNDYNLAQLRLVGDLEVAFSPNLRGVFRLRSIYEGAPYDEFDPNDVDSNAAGYLYGRPNYFEYDDFDRGGSQNRLEVAGENYMIDLPSAYLDYQNGPLLLRLGNQQIAWGQALFFRVLDVPNGLDLRRHLILDFAAEEYADERIASPAIRTSWQFSQEWGLDAFVQMFQPTIYPNPNTPYNVIASQFTVRDSFESVDDELNYGLRVKGAIGDFGLQFIYADRLNPDGVFRWTESGVDRDVPGIPGSGEIVARTPLEVDSSGVCSATEWFTYAAMARLDGVGALNAMVDDFPAARELLAQNVNNQEEAEKELDLFFQLAGGKLNDPFGSEGGCGFRGHIARDYKREDNYGAGVSYVVSGKPGSLLDQLIINFELLYTPDRHFTNTTLSQKYIVEDEYVGALVMEKYHRFSQSFPATYMVFQWMHRTESDLFGRHLSGMGATVDNAPPPGVDGGWDGIVFALQQPFPNLIWRVDFAALYDTRGGLFMQPALRWKPSGAITVEAFYNYVKEDLRSGKENQNIMETLNFVDELGLRLSYQF